MKPKLYHHKLTDEEIVRIKRGIEHDFMMAQCQEFLGVYKSHHHDDPKYHAECFLCGNRHDSTQEYYIAVFNDGYNVDFQQSDASVYVCLDRDACSLRAACRSEEP